ncbi:MAG: GNAT family N-acetyltransferase [Sporolactobacillus sp.]|jgi:phosphinothricin acetyltransferase|nr:GNAT family N-acetyltransferase [Sporolactobacillus sp.]
MEKNIVIRDAVEDDLPAIVAIYNSTIQGRMVTADTSEVSIQDRRPWFEAQRANPNRPLWVAERSGMICGWIALETFYGRPAYRGTVEVSLYIAPGFRRQGIGSLLLHRAIECAETYAIHTLLAFIFARNRPSLHLFTRSGFSQWGRLPKVAVLDGIGCDLIIMGRQVTTEKKAAPRR